MTSTMSGTDTQDLPRTFLLPGESAFARKPALLCTLLGSCVAVCLYNKKLKWGGMNHFLLPTKNGGSLPPGKYGDASTKALLQVARAAGSDDRDLVASVYGGGNVIGHLGSAATTGVANVGERNIAMALDLMRIHKIRVVQRGVGGTQGRKIYMNTETNDIEVKMIASSDVTKAKAERMNRFANRDVRVLVVDDSSTVRKLISAGIEGVDGITVVGQAENPYEARELIVELDPDVICLDIIMPRMDGLSFLRKLMQYKPISTVIVSTIAKRGSEMQKKVLEAGAMDVVDKEELEIYKNRDAVKQVLVPKLLAAAKSVARKKT